MSFFAEESRKLHESLRSLLEEDAGSDAVAAAISGFLEESTSAAEAHGTSARSIVSASCVRVVLGLSTGEGVGGAGVAGKVGVLFDAGISLALGGKVDASLPLVVLDRALECCSLRESGELWSLLEERREVFARPSILPRTRNPPSKLVLLQLSNGLFRRLGHSQRDVQLRGRVLLFLAHVLPLTDKSGVNLTGTLSTPTLPSARRQEEGKAAEEGAGEGGEGGDALYAHFWALQRVAGDPIQVAKSKEAWGSFETSVKRVVEGMERELQARGGGKALGGGGGAVEGEAGVEEAGKVEGRYLTSRGLFRLQLGDVQVQRQVLVELLLVLGYLLDLPASRRADVADSVDLVAGVAALWQVVEERLRHTPPDGKGLAEVVLRLLREERRWRAWKALKCPPLERIPLPAASTIHSTILHQTRLSSQSSSSSSSSSAASSSSSTSTPLPFPPSKLCEGVEAVVEAEGKEEERSGVLVGVKRRREWFLADLPCDDPFALTSLATDGERLPKRSLRSHVAPLEEAFDPKNPFADPDTSPHNSPAWVWRSVRLLAESEPAMLHQLAEETKAVEGADAKERELAKKRAEKEAKKRLLRKKKKGKKEKGGEEGGEEGGGDGGDGGDVTSSPRVPKSMRNAVTRVICKRFNIPLPPDQQDPPQEEEDEEDEEGGGDEEEATEKGDTAEKEEQQGAGEEKEQGDKEADAAASSAASSSPPAPQSSPAPSEEEDEEVIQVPETDAS